MTTFEEGKEAIHAASDQRNPAPPGSAFQALQKAEDIAGFTKAGVKITSVETFGDGPDAIVDVNLNDGKRIVFERFEFVTKPAMLVAHIVTSTGINPGIIKGPKAVEFASCIWQAARHQLTGEQDEQARTWGRRYLEAIQPGQYRDLNMGDTKERYSVFVDVFRSPNARTRGGYDEHGNGYVHAHVVLRDRKSGVRYVNREWFTQWLRADERLIPRNLASRMLHVGWQQNGGEGRINGYSPGFKDQINRTFYNVPVNWEHGPKAPS